MFFILSFHVPLNLQNIDQKKVNIENIYSRKQLQNLQNWYAFLVNRLSPLQLYMFDHL